MMTPTRDVFTDDREILVDLGSGPDTLGRFQFTAYWLTDQGWVPGGVRGQVFHTVLTAWVARNVAAGCTVRFVGARAAEYLATGYLTQPPAGAR